MPATVNELLARHGHIDAVHRSPEELDPNYERELVARGGAKTYFRTTTRVVDFIPEPKQQKPPGKVKSFFNSLKNPALQRREQLPDTEGVTYHTNEKGQIIETRTIRVAVVPPATAWIGDAGGSA